MTGGFAARTRARLREEILAATAAEVLAQGWRGLRMQAVADAVGVSRQTINNEFHTKQGLAEALVLAIASEYTYDNLRTVATSPDVTSAIRDTVRTALERTAHDEVLRAVLAPDASDTFLPLYTSAGAPLVTRFTSGMTVAFTRRWPELNPERVRIAMEAATRFVISHILLPLHPAEQVAEEAAALFGGYLSGTAPVSTAPARSWSGSRGSQEGE
jgi:AcrR family transcriptional regulator